jgi:hypothetical protein
MANDISVMLVPVALIGALMGIVGVLIKASLRRTGKTSKQGE